MTRDRGFTLVELIVVISLMVVITSSVGTALYLGFRTTSNTYTRLDQSNAALAVNHALGGDMFAAEGPLLVASGDVACGGQAPLKLWIRSSATKPLDTLVVWVRSGTDLVRRSCLDGVQTSSTVVARQIGAFEVGACATSCSAGIVTVRFVTSGSGTVDAQTWTIDLARRGATS